jgi:hypothetical protein
VERTGAIACGGGLKWAASDEIKHSGDPPDRVLSVVVGLNFEQWLDDPRQSRPGNLPLGGGHTKDVLFGLGRQRLPTCLTRRVEQVQRGAIPDATNNLSPQPVGEAGALVKVLRCW